ncbi:MAG TPA: hypothetical protein ENN81_06795 [Phycisphaerales bacterium]|nr:hypothetical protein [Phycisphaerales bacterium]
MSLARRHHRYRRGVSLVETMVAAVVLLIAIVGTSAFRYNCALDARKAKAQMAAARIALVLCESWRGSYGNDAFDPLLLAADDFAIVGADDGPAAPDEFTTLGTYAVTLNDEDQSNVRYVVTLAWMDVESGLRALSATVGWIQRDSGDIAYTSGNPDKSLKLTTYAQTL